MLSLLTYGATFGVAETSGDTRHEWSRSTDTAPFDQDWLDHAELEQNDTKGGVIGWLKRLVQRQT